jgi:hypothetical protein
VLLTTGGGGDDIGGRVGGADVWFGITVGGFAFIVVDRFLLILICVFNWSTSCLNSVICPRIVSIAPLFACIVVISTGSIVGCGCTVVGVGVVCCSRLVVVGSFAGDEDLFSLLFFVTFCKVVESDCDETKFFACNAGLDASTIFLSVS